MAETSSPCLVRSFSQPSSTSYNGGHEGDLLCALSSSISFGRYMSESLAWEKWSTFTHNKYREEAERYSRPGSVAEKKAFFEARYKKIAAKKSADSSVEQQSAAAVDNNGSMVLSESAENGEHVSTEKMEGEENQNQEISNDDAMPKQSTEEQTMKPSTKCGLPKPPLVVKPPSIQSKKTENSTTPRSSNNRTPKGSAIKNRFAPRSLQVVSTEFGRDEPAKMSSPILQKIANSKFVRAITNSMQESRSQKSPIMESGISLLSKNVTSEPDVHVCMDSESAENVINHVGTEEMQGEEFPNEQPTFSNNQEEVDKGIEKKMPYIDEKMGTQGAITKGESLVSDEATHSSTTMKPSSKCGLPKHKPVKQLSIQSKKTEHSTPSRSLHTTKGGVAIKSLSDNFEHDETIKPPSPILQRIVNSKFVRAITNTTRDSRPQKSPKASSYSLSKHVTSDPESRRTITIPDCSLSRSRIMEVQSQEPCTGNSKSPTARGSKTQPSTTCSSFVFRSEERAIKRKEFYQKLEQKLKEEQELQTKATGKKSVSRVQENGSRPPWRLPGKSDSLKDVVGKTNNKPFIHSAKLFPKESRRENASPNIHSAKLFPKESRRENASPNIQL